VSNMIFPYTVYTEQARADGADIDAWMKVVRNSTPNLLPLCAYHRWDSDYQKVVNALSEDLLQYDATMVLTVPGTEAASVYHIESIIFNTESGYTAFLLRYLT